MKIICSWCKKLIGEKEPFDDPSETHGKCPDCLEKEKKKARGLIKEAADVTRSGFPSQELLEKTIKVWQPHSKEPLTMEDAREIVVNTCNFFNLLIELDEKYSGRKSENKASSI